MELNINPNWSFKEAVSNLLTLKTQYREILASFSYFQMRELVTFKRETRNAIYSLSIDDWKKDRLWEYMNDFLEFDILKRIK